jgi:excisionase family DNA binding protein
MATMATRVSDTSEETGTGAREARETGEKLLLKIPEAAKLLGFATSFTYELVLRGEIPSIKIGKKARRIPTKALEAYIERLLREQGRGRG